MPGVYPDVRRPEHHEGRIQLLISELGCFSTMRDLLVFAAALGFAKDRREEFTPGHNPIAFATMAVNPLFEQLLLMITAASASDTPEALGEDAQRDRVVAFEEYACGGLSLIQGQMGLGREPGQAVLDLVTQQIADIDLADPDYSPNDVVE